MRKQFTIFLILIFVFGLVPVDFSNAENLTDRLKGKILLQVESNGEAWYINPDNSNRYYLGRPADAFSVMRELGLGISNKDFNSFNNVAPKKLSGKILLKVEDSGKAYYINPDDFKMHFLGRPADAFKVMRELGLGINNKDLNEIIENGQLDTSNLTLLSNAEIIKKLKPAVVYIETKNGSGSGIIIESNEYILTNAHVVQGNTTVKVIFFDNSFLDAFVVGRDEEIDLAVLKVKKSGMQKVIFGNSDLVNQGDEIFTLGYPFGIKGNVSFKEGTLSRILKDKDNNYLEISADIHPGNSGGPLVNRYGQIVGINSFIFGESVQGVNIEETIKFAIPINVAKDILGDLKNGRNIVIKQKINDSIKGNNINRLQKQINYFENIFENILIEIDTNCNVLATYNSVIYYNYYNADTFKQAFPKDFEYYNNSCRRSFVNIHNIEESLVAEPELIMTRLYMTEYIKQLKQLSFFALDNKKNNKLLDQYNDNCDELKTMIREEILKAKRIYNLT